MSMILANETLKKYLNPVLVETGTYDGQGVALALQVGFAEVRSVEIDPEQYEHVRRRFEYDARVKLYLGDSGKLLWDMIQDVEQSITFWLDAHEFYGSRGEKLCPLLEELEQIARHQVKNHTILMDDRRVFKQWGINESDVLYRVYAINPAYRISYEANSQRPDDVLVAQLP